MALVTALYFSRTVENNPLAISKPASRGIELTNHEMGFFELLGDCLAPELKSILRLPGVDCLGLFQVLIHFWK